MNDIFSKAFVLIVSSVISLSCANVAQASDLDFAVLVGTKNNSATTDITGATVTSKFGIMVGVLGLLPLTRNGFGIRSGGIYNQRYVTMGPSNQGDIEIQYTYFDIPMTPMLQIDRLITLFAGPVLAFNQSKDVSCSKAPTCAAADVKSFLMPIQIGADFRFAPQFGGEVFFESISGDISKNVANMTSVGFAGLIFFE